MAKGNLSNTGYNVRDILIIISYILILLLIAILVWKFASPFLAAVATGLIAYFVDLRKLINKK